MKRTQGRRKPPEPLGTIREVPQPLWERVAPIPPESRPKKRTGRRPAHWRQVLNGIIFRMRTGCRRDRLPRRLGPRSTVHDWLQRWVEGGVPEASGAVLVAECDALQGVEWQGQAADGAPGKARLGGRPSGPTRPLGARTAPSGARSSRAAAGRWASS